MSDIIEVHIWVTKHRMGDFVCDLPKKIPYAKIVRWIPNLNDIEDETHKEPPLAITDQRNIKKDELTRQQKSVLSAIKGGSASKISISLATGIGKNSLGRLTRVITNLKKKKLVKGVDGSYAAM